MYRSLRKPIRMKKQYLRSKNGESKQIQKDKSNSCCLSMTDTKGHIKADKRQTFTR
uniref:Uncharacterized protein n=1 Tax=Rhizophora mucronata TaxID=61149 RepID=A0A2P2QPW3_RHIMU